MLWLELDVIFTDFTWEKPNITELAICISFFTSPAWFIGSDKEQYR